MKSGVDRTRKDVFGLERVTQPTSVAAVSKYQRPDADYVIYRLSSIDVGRQKRIKSLLRRRRGHQWCRSRPWSMPAIVARSEPSAAPRAPCIVFVSVAACAYAVER
jgi:hypothetical protein